MNLMTFIVRIVALLTVMAIPLVTLQAIAEPQSSDRPSSLDYVFEEIAEMTTDCPPGEHCLLAPYLSVAIFADRQREGRKVAVLLEDYFYCHAGTGSVYRVPAGFETDFLSIPEMARGIFRPMDYMDAAVVHDWLYAVGEADKQDVADRIFVDVLSEQGAPKVVRSLMHQAVKFGGKKAYGSTEEWRFVDLVTMAILSPPPFDRPETAAFAQMSCTDPKAFAEFREQHRTGLQYELRAKREGEPRSFRAFRF